MDMVLLDRLMPALMQGLTMTMKIFVIAIIAGFILGLVVALMRLSKIWIVKSIASVYVTVIRGTPMIVQLFFIYFGINSLDAISLDNVTAGILTLTLNAGAYFAEIIRAGILAVDKGQVEAARSLGMSKTKTMTLIVIPQALRRMVPTITNQSIISLKDTSLLSIIGIADITQRGDVVASATFQSFEVWTIVGCVYLVIIWILTLIGSYIERKYQIK